MHSSYCSLEYQQNLKQSVESNCIPAEANKEPLNVDMFSNTTKEVRGEIECNGVPSVQKGDTKARIANMSESMIEDTLSERDSNRYRVKEKAIELNTKSMTQNSRQRMSETMVFKNSRKRKFPDEVCRENILSCVAYLVSQKFCSFNFYVIMQ